MSESAPGAGASYTRYFAASDPLRDIDAVDGNVSQRAAVLALLKVPVGPPAGFLCLRDR